MYQTGPEAHTCEPVPVWLPDGMLDDEFMRRIRSYPGWSKGPWNCFPTIGEVRQNDCHSQLKRAFTHAGVSYPSNGVGRVIWDELGILDSNTAARIDSWGMDEYYDCAPRYRRIGHH